MRQTRAERGFSIALGAFACVLAVHLFLQSPFFRLQRIEVNGTVTLTEADILRLADVGRADHVYDIDLVKLKERLLTEPRIASVALRRRLPGRLIINVHERTPVAQVVVAGRLWLVDAFGCNMGENKGDLSLIVIVPAADSSVPAVRGCFADPAVLAAAGLAADLPGYVAATVTEIRARAVDKLELVSRDGIIIRFGSWSDVELKSEVYWSLRQQLPADGDLPDYIDVIRPESPLVR